MSLLRKMLAIKPVRTPLDFGINEDVRLTAIDNETRKWEGEVIPRNTFLTFTKFDNNGNKIAKSEFSYFNLDHTSDFVFDNLVQQVGQLNNIASILCPGSVVDPTVEFEDLEEIKEAIRTKKGCQTLMDTIWEQFHSAVSEFIGDESQLLRIKVVTDNKGKWLQLPRDAHFLESVDSDSTLSISAYELKMFNKGSEPAQETADEKADAPDDKPKKKSALAGL